MLWNKDLTNDVTASTRRPTTFSQFFFSRTSNLFFAFLLTLILPSKASLECYYGPLPLRLCFCQFLVFLGQKNIANFLAKAGASFPCAVPSVVVLCLFFPIVATTRLDVAHLEMPYFTFSSESSSLSIPFGAITPVFPYTNCKLSHLCCYGQSLI